MDSRACPRSSRSAAAEVERAQFSLAGQARGLPAPQVRAMAAAALPPVFLMGDVNPQSGLVGPVQPRAVDGADLHDLLLEYLKTTVPCR
ncbi:MAG: hypothetical protein AB7G93_22185 [Bdellovibrionales bacterium]